MHPPEGPRITSSSPVAARPAGTGTPARSQRPTARQSSLYTSSWGHAPTPLSSRCCLMLSSLTCHSRVTPPASRSVLASCPSCTCFCISACPREAPEGEIRLQTPTGYSCCSEVSAQGGDTRKSYRFSSSMIVSNQPLGAVLRRLRGPRGVSASPWGRRSPLLRQHYTSEVGMPSVTDGSNQSGVRLPGKPEEREREPVQHLAGTHRVLRG